MAKDPSLPIPRGGKLYLTWEWVMRRAARGVAYHKHKGPYKGVLGVSRGGLPLATLYAVGLGIRDLGVVKAVTKHSLKEDPSLELCCEYSAPEEWMRDGGKGILVVDDLSDTGETFRQIRQILPNAHCTALLAKPEGRSQVHSYSTDVDQDVWVIFPWEAESGWMENFGPTDTEFMETRSEYPN